MTHHHLDLEESSPYHPFFLQGASEVISYLDSFVALWTENTPELNGEPVATIGGCSFAPPQEGVALLAYAAEYLQKSFQTVIGPMNGNTWLEHRLVTYSDSSPPFALEPCTPPEWAEVFQNAGFSVLSRYSSSRLTLGSERNEKLEKLALRLSHKGVQIRPLNPDRFTEDLSAIYDLSCTCFKENFLYTELPKSLFLSKYAASKSQLDPDLILLAEKDGELIGYVFCYPSSTETIVVKTLARHPERGVAGIGNVLVEQVQLKALSKGYQCAIHALQYEDNSSLKITSRYNSEVFRRYALMRYNSPNTI